MSSIPYILNTGKIADYFQKIIETGVPDKVNTEWLTSIGFTSSNDRPIISIWKLLGFIDDTNKPTEYWIGYRTRSNSKKIMAIAIKEGYSDLFAVYPDAFRRDKEALYAYFASKTKVAEKTVNYIVLTFLKICELADFENSEYIEIAPIEIKEKSKKINENTFKKYANIQININLPATENIEIYNKIFDALKKHLLMDES